MKATLIIRLTACLLGVSASALAATYNFKTVDFPGAFVTLPGGINSVRQIAGLYDAEAPYSLAEAHGFLRTGSRLPRSTTRTPLQPSRKESMSPVTLSEPSRMPLPGMNTAICLPIPSSQPSISQEPS